MILYRYITIEKIKKISFEPRINYETKLQETDKN